MITLIVTACALNPLSLIADCRVVYESAPTLKQSECEVIGSVLLNRAMRGALIGKYECGDVVVFARKDKDGRIYYERSRPTTT